MNIPETIITDPPLCPKAQCRAPLVEREPLYLHEVETNKRYLTMDEVAKYLGISRWTVYNLVSKRELPFIALSKRAFRFDRLKVDKWMEKREVKDIKDLV